MGGRRERERESENDNYWYVGWDREDRRWTWEGPNSDGSKGKVKWIFGEESQKRAYKKPGRVGVNEAKARYGPQAFRQEKLKKKLKGIDINLQIGHETRTPYMCSIVPDNTEDWLENIAEPRKNGSQGINKFILIKLDLYYCQFLEIKGNNTSFCFCYWHISIILGSLIAGFNCICMSLWKMRTDNGMSLDGSGYRRRMGNTSVV